MKKLLLIAIIIAGLGFYFLQSEPEERDVPSPATTNFKPDPSNATFTVEGRTFRLSDGIDLIKTNDGGDLETHLLEETATGDLNNDGKEDTVLLLGQSGGGSGFFIYAAAYISGPVSYKGTNAIFIGDRISPENISINKGIVTVSFLDRGVDEPFSAEPTRATLIRFVYNNGKIEQIK